MANVLTLWYRHHDIHEVFQTIAIALVRADAQRSTWRSDSNHVAVEVPAGG